MSPTPESPLERFPALGERIGCELFVKRDDLLPVPLAGNKVRKLEAELDSVSAHGAEVLLTTGAVGSNHCRTLALLAARRGIRAHLVLHGGNGAQDAPALRILEALGATWTRVPPERIAPALRRAEEDCAAAGLRVHTVAGGCHTPAGARAYRRAAEAVLAELRPDAVFVASGTGATHGGIAAAAQHSDRGPRVIGISVAREALRGLPAAAEAARWAGGDGEGLVFDDRFRAGGYGCRDSGTDSAVRLGWQHGLPLDPTYTGKAFAGLLRYAAEERWADRGGPRGRAPRVLFWHTGGLMNALTAFLPDAAGREDQPAPSAPSAPSAPRQSLVPTGATS
jgi:1-aminocyclopropane-1-carboxylate deaminase/D-cysteine desulfhydrase-like pyridoxal-dependent ACC family enzyme